MINAFRHAFPDGRSAITVSDNGVGLPEGFVAEASASFGWQLINSLAKQIGGTMAVTRGHGTTVTVSFPYREVVS